MEVETVSFFFNNFSFLINESSNYCPRHLVSHEDLIKNITITTLELQEVQYFYSY